MGGRRYELCKVEFRTFAGILEIIVISEHNECWSGCEKKLKVCLVSAEIRSL